MKRKIRKNGNHEKLSIKKDIVIPAGTVLDCIPPGSETIYGDDIYECTVGLADDSSGDFVYCIDSKDNKLGEWFEEC